MRPEPAIGQDFVDTQPGDCGGYLTYPCGSYQTCSYPPEEEGYCSCHVATILQMMGLPPVPDSVEEQNVDDVENLIGFDDVSTVEERNTEVFFKIADVLDFHPVLYNQETFGTTTTSGSGAAADDDDNIIGDNDIFLLNVESCRTSACVAGWAAILDGWHPTLGWDLDGVTLNYDEVAREPWALDTSDEARPIVGVAQEILGITEAEAVSLFAVCPDGALGEAWTGDELRAIGKGRSVFSDNWPGEGS